MERLWQDIRYAIRTIANAPGFSAIAIIALTLGIGANTALFTVVNTILLQPLAYRDSHQLVQIARDWQQGNTTDSLSLTKLIYWRDHNHSFSTVAASDILPAGCNLTGSGQPVRVPCVRITTDYFKLFATPLTIGREFTSEEDRPNGAKVAIISYGLWQRQFGGDPNITGKTINIRGDAHVIVGVASRDFVSPLKVDVWTPLRPVFDSQDRANYLNVYGRLKPGVTVQAAHTDLNNAYQKFIREYPNLKDDDHESVGVYALHEHTVGNVRNTLLILFGAVAFVLLIASSNVANLLLARATGRSKEVAIRLALGAGRGRLIRQFLTESILLAGIGGGLGVLLASWAVKAFVAINPGNLPRVAEIQMDWRVLAFTAAVSVITGVLFGLAPAIQMSGGAVNETLKEGGRGSTGTRKTHRMRNALVAFETALALVLVVGAALLIESFQRLNHVEPGFETANVITFKSSLNPKRIHSSAESGNFDRQYIERVRTMPGVVAVAKVVNLPMEPGADLPFDIEGRERNTADGSGGAQYRTISGDYFAALTIPLRSGRYFNDRDTANSAPVIIINETFAKRFFKKSNPIGQRITIGRVMGPQLVDRTREVVGVVGDVRSGGLNNDVPETMFIPDGQAPDGVTKLISTLIPYTWIVKTQSDPSKRAQEFVHELVALDADLAVSDIKPLGDVILASTTRERFNMTLIGSMAALALLLASIGIYGVISYGVNQRSHEMGVRMALGAGSLHLMRLIVGQGLLVAGIGVAIGIAAALAVSKALTALLYGVQARDPYTLAGVSALLLAVAAVASYIPARRAAKVDPVITLRYE